MPSRKARRPVQPLKSTSGPTAVVTASSSSLDTKAERLAARTLRRKTQAYERRVKADALKDKVRHMCAVLQPLRINVTR